MVLRHRIIVVITMSLLIVVIPATDFVVTLSAQTKTAASKKKKTSSSGNQKKVSSQKKNSSQKNTSAQSKRRNSNNQKKKNSSTPKSSAEAKRLQEAAQRDIQQTKEKLRLNEQEVKAGLSDLNRLSSEIATGRAKVDGLQKKVTSLKNEIAYLGDEISKNEAELKLMREEYLKAVKKLRLTKKNQSTLAFVFASENFNQAMRRIRYMRQFSEWKSKKSADIDKKIEQLGNERTRLAEVKESQTVALGQLQESQQQLEANHKKQEELVASLRRNGDALQAHLVAKQNEANRLKETISALIAQEQAKAEAERKAREKAEAERIAREKAEAERKAAEKVAAEKAAAEKLRAENTEKEQSAKNKDKAKKEKEKKKSSEKASRNKRGDKNKKIDKVQEPSKVVETAPVVTAKNVEKTAVGTSSGIDFANLRGRLPRPVDGSWRITNPFGRHAMPELPEVEYDNPGIDAEVATGATVKSVCGGKVSGVYKVAGYGTVVIVNHGDYYTVYGNLASTNVSVGTQVGGGSVLGTAGTDPDDSRRGSVHFEVWKGREKLNPSSWLR